MFMSNRQSSNLTTSHFHGTRWSVLGGSTLAALALFAAPVALDLGTHGASGLVGTATAAPPPGAGGGKPDQPPGQGGSPGGGKPDNPGGGKPAFPGSGKGDFYSDLVPVWRDEYGRPIMVQMQLLPEVEGEPSAGTVFCLQPIAAGAVPDLPQVINLASGETVSLIQLGTGVPGEECDVNPDPDNVALLQEVLFGRLNLGRSPTKVLEQQLREVTNTLAASASPIQIDEAGRFVWYDAAGTGFEVDSPGNNLALHKELQVEGLPLVSQTQVPIPLPAVANPDDPTGFLDHAAAALGAAAGKGDLITLDLVVYNNAILNIPNETTVLNTVEGGTVAACPSDLPTGYSVDDECQYGEIVRTGPAQYIDYGAVGYSYTRSEVFPGCVRGLLLDFPTAGVYTPFSGTIMDCTFGDIDWDGANATCSGGVDFTGDTGLESFAQRADDARAVIAFTHDNVVADSTAILPASQAGVDQAGGTAVCADMGL